MCMGSIGYLSFGPMAQYVLCMRSKAWLAARVSLRLARLPHTASTARRSRRLCLHSLRSQKCFHWVPNLCARRYCHHGMPGLLVCIHSKAWFTARVPLVEACTSCLFKMGHSHRWKLMNITVWWFLVRDVCDDVMVARTGGRRLVT